MLIGGIVPATNLPGVASNKLTLSGAVLADIMAGHISKWNDPRIGALNAGVNLPAKPIVRIVRADRSGTAEGFTGYLSDVSESFKQEIGPSQLPAWVGNVLKAEGNDGVVKLLKNTEGAITYVSYDRILRDELAAVRLVNAAGHAVAASETGFRAAIGSSEMAKGGNDTASLLNQKSSTAWPITMTSFVLLDQTPESSQRAGQVMKFVYWSFMHGDELTNGTGFAPLPTAIQARLTARLAGVKPKDGKNPDYAGM